MSRAGQRRGLFDRGPLHSVRLVRKARSRSFDHFAAVQEVKTDGGREKGRGGEAGRLGEVWNTVLQPQQED